ncbi:uncharacterized protein LOC112905331 [Agrilus planipennis]|uniref:Uncharacterized protein LOC112905331 n=1 Tax=Agrilus planipennis TaxID=224129 RepID=A0A7F5RBE6_AGRPL|nr:uncharacterized protein LOC112905331 [Agrilus planipennis]
MSGSIEPYSLFGERPNAKTGQSLLFGYNLLYPGSRDNPTLQCQEYHEQLRTQDRRQGTSERLSTEDSPKRPTEMEEAAAPTEGEDTATDTDEQHLPGIASRRRNSQRYYKRNRTFGFAKSIIVAKAKACPTSRHWEKHRWTTLAGLLARSNIKFLKARNIADGISVHPETAMDYKNMKQLLVREKVEYHTYLLQEDKPLKVVLRGIPTDIQAADVSEDLKAQGFNVENVVRMTSAKTKTPIPLVLVILPKDDKRPPSASATDVKRFGHAQRNCTATARCVKYGVRIEQPNRSVVRCPRASVVPRPSGRVNTNEFGRTRSSVVLVKRVRWSAAPSPGNGKKRLRGVTTSLSVLVPRKLKKCDVGTAERHAEHMIIRELVPLKAETIKVADRRTIRDTADQLMEELVQMAGVVKELRHTIERKDAEVKEVKENSAKTETAKKYRLFADLPRDNDIIDVQLQDRQLERRVNLADTTHPADMDNFRFTEGVQNAYETVCYTDGSRLDDGRAGGSFILYHGDTEIHRENFTLAENSTIFQCEMVALRQAVTHLQGQTDIIKECSIVTDSLSVLTALRNMKQPTALQLETWELAVSLAAEISLRFHWTPSHSGNAKNDAADEFAKAAATDQATAPIYDLVPRAVVKRRLRTLSLEAWKERWRTATTGRTTASFLPEPCYDRKITGNFDFYMVQLMTGHGNFKSYLKRIGKIEDDICECGGTDTAEHVLFECDLVEQHRGAADRALAIHGLRWPTNYREVTQLWNERDWWDAFRTFSGRVEKLKVDN